MALTIGILGGFWQPAGMLRIFTMGTALGAILFTPIFIARERTARRGPAT